MGVVLGVRGSRATTHEAFMADLKRVTDRLAESRPTAVNLFWALDEMTRAAEARGDQPIDDVKACLLDRAKAILEDDRARCRAIGENGAALIPDNAVCMTHCNAGALATGGTGTALSVFYAAHAQGKSLRVFSDETRPLLQGARITAWELMKAGIDVTVICDSAAAHTLRTKCVDAVVVGADRIAANGDAANKIGTYGLALAAKAHGVPFYVAAPISTFDLSLPSGDGIPIEERDAEEVACFLESRAAPEGAQVFNPAFDVTPAEYIAAIITERGIIEQPDARKVAEHIAS